MLLIFCAMVRSGGASISPERYVHDILDSTVFNVAMFAIGWAATRRGMKGGETPSCLQWLKAVRALPLPLFPSVVYSRSRTGDAAIEAKLPPNRSDNTELEGPLPELPSQLPNEEPSAALLQEPQPELPRQPPNDEDSAALLAGLACILSERIASVESLETLPWRRSCFHSGQFWDWSLSEYVTHIHWFFECSSPCLVLALIYFERAIASGTKLMLSSETCHRLFLTSLLVASKFHDDDSAPYSNDFYANVGHVAVEDLNDMEKQFCKLIDWRFYVKPEEYLLKLDLITSAGYLQK